VSNPEIERLVQDRSLIRESFDDEQVAGYWAKAMSSLVDAQADRLSTDGAYQMAYTAALQASLAVLAAHNLKVRGTSNHYMTFHAVQRLNPTMRDCGRKFDALRLARHQSIYEPEHDEVESVNRLARAMDALRVGLPASRAEIVAVRPAAATMLAPLAFGST
jgi:hypothetical protein